MKIGATVRRVRRTRCGGALHLRFGALLDSPSGASSAFRFCDVEAALRFRTKKRGLFGDKRTHGSLCKTRQRPVQAKTGGREPTPREKRQFGKQTRAGQ